MKNVTRKSFIRGEVFHLWYKQRNPATLNEIQSRPLFIHISSIIQTEERRETHTHWMKNQSLEIFSSVTKSVSHPSENRMREPGSMKIPDSVKSFHPWHSWEKNEKGGAFHSIKSPVGWSKIAQVGNRYEWFCHFSLPQNLQESAVTDLFTKLFSLPFFSLPSHTSTKSGERQFHGLFLWSVFKTCSSNSSSLLACLPFSKPLILQFLTCNFLSSVSVSVSVSVSLSLLPWCVDDLWKASFMSSQRFLQSFPTHLLFFCPQSL